MKKFSKLALILWAVAALFFLVSFSFITSGKIGEFVTGIVVTVVLGFIGWLKREPKASPAQQNNFKSQPQASTTPVAAAPSVSTPITVPATVSGYELKYSYNDVIVAYSNTFDLSVVSIGAYLDIEEELTNEHDPKAVSVKYKGAKLGYLPQNRLQGMVHDFRSRSGDILARAVSKENNNLIISIGYYDEVESELDKLLASDVKRKSFKLSGNTKDDMQENIGLCSVGDEITFSYDSDKDKMLASCGCDLGYVSKSIEEYLDGLPSYAAYIEEIEESENGKNVVKVVVFEQ